MHRRIRSVATTLVVVLGAGLALAKDEAPKPFDRVKLRLELLQSMDRRIADRAARAHLEARMMLDRVLPLPYLGVDADPVEGGMSVTKVYPLTGAESAGVKLGDVITQVGDYPAGTPADLGLAIRAHEVGDTVPVRLRRDGKELELQAHLGTRPEEDEDEAEQFPAYAYHPEVSHTDRHLDFQGLDAGASCDLLEPLLGGHGRPPHYVARREGKAVYLRQDDGDPTGIRFPMAWVREFWAHDVVAKVRFRLAGGRQDQAAGLVVRGLNDYTYLVARANAVEGDLRIFRAANGLRRTLPGARGKVQVGDGAWHVLRVRAEGPRITAQVDGGPEVVGYDTYVSGGRAGLWTKSDAVTDFDDLELHPLAAKDR